MIPRVKSIYRSQTELGALLKLATRSARLLADSTHQKLDRAPKSNRDRLPHIDGRLARSISRCAALTSDKKGESIHDLANNSRLCQTLQDLFSKIVPHPVTF